MAYTAPPRPQNQPLLGIIVRLCAMAVLAAMIALVKLASARGVHIVESVFYRQVFALIFLLPIVWQQGGFASIKTQRPGRHVMRLIVGLTGMLFNFWAVSLLPLAEATTIAFTVPIFATILAIIILAENVGWRRWAAILLGFAGVLAVVQPGNAQVSIYGAVVALAGAFFTAWVSIIIRQLGQTEKPVTVVFWFTLLSLPALTIAIFWFGTWHDPVTWLIIAGIGLFGGLGQLTLTWSLRLAPVSIVMSADYTSLIWATLFGWLIWDTLPTIWTILGAPLIVGAGIYIAWRERKLNS